MESLWFSGMGEGFITEDCCPWMNSPAAVILGASGRGDWQPEPRALRER